MGYGKNNRRRGKVKVTRTTKKTIKFKSKLVGDQKLKAKWDHMKTTKQNYEALGLIENPNLVNKNSRLALEQEEVEFIDIPEQDDSRPLVLQEPNHKKDPNHMSEEEIKYLRPLMAKYDSKDYGKMALDIKVNNMQWTESKLKRRCERLMRLDESLSN